MRSPARAAEVKGLINHFTFTLLRYGKGNCSCSKIRLRRRDRRISPGGIDGTEADVGATEEGLRTSKVIVMDGEFGVMELN